MMLNAKLIILRQRFFTCDKIAEAIKSLWDFKAAGTDGIKPCVLKNLRPIALNRNSSRPRDGCGELPGERQGRTVGRNYGVRKQNVGVRLGVLRGARRSSHHLDGSRRSAFELKRFA